MTDNYKDYNEEDYYAQLEQEEWWDYVDYCVDFGCSNCGEKVVCEDIVDWHSCVNCEGVV